jgi:hypothetical protein
VNEENEMESDLCGPIVSIRQQALRQTNVVVGEMLRGGDEFGREIGVGENL